MLVHTPPPVNIDDADNARYQKVIKSFKGPIFVGDGIQLTVKDINELVARQKPMPAKVMDALCRIGRHLLRADSRKPIIDVLDTKCVSMLTKFYLRFNKTVNKNEFKFSKAVINIIEGAGDPDRAQLFTQADYLYLSFNLDAKHWLFLAVDLFASKILVLDCNANLRSDASMLSEICPLAVMLPFLFREVALNERMSQVASTDFEIERIATVPHIKSNHDSGMVSDFLMLDHAIFGLQARVEYDLSNVEMDTKKLTMVLIEKFKE